MARALIVLAVAAVVFWVFSIVDCAVQPASRHRGVSKSAWLLIVVLIPVIGGLLWFVIGRSRPGSQPVGPRAPDDDPAFLGSIGSTAEQDERIRQLEEELARLDAEDVEQGENDGDEKPDSDDDARDARGSLG
ncbi:PLD nuclease N-terminal domain-containing protein [Microbacterium betulae]|uniref:PLD nuclease N-terminal domain-containing protein n=1 Tax=Microbacterium betulae TaxID=2981139 RepID=A0AA97FJU1_9MICO|nr:PLD nuclease N-terminal domain-containing protein [Microbacterium sp. AB]WOF23615.1 PLD nuclease N-terminal domain-containing protein [Microbacterium sp. AB]